MVLNKLKLKGALAFHCPTSALEVQIPVIISMGDDFFIGSKIIFS